MLIAPFVLLSGALVFVTTPLMRALEEGLPRDCVHALIQGGADPNATHGSLEISALVVAASCSTAEVLSLLLGSGAEVDYTTPDGWTALMSAARNSSRPEVIRKLPPAGASVNAVDKYGVMPLMRAAQTNPNPEIIEAKGATRGRPDYRDAR